MLVLTRKTNESIVIGGNVRITIVRIMGNRVRIGVEAPEGTKVLRHELELERKELGIDERESA